VGRAQKALLDAILDGEIPGDDPDAARAFLTEHPELLRGE
jgi:anti-sigma factor RsiW